MDYKITSGQDKALEDRIVQKLRNLVKFSTVTRSTSVGTADGGSGPPSTQSYQLDIRRMQHFGFRSVPPAGTRQILVHPEAGSTQAVSVAEDDQHAGPGSLANGETSLYSKANSAVLIADKDGHTKITSSGSSNVVLNGGSLKVARDTDPTGSGTLACVMAGPVAGITTATITWVPEGGGAPTTLAVLNFVGTGTGGSVHVVGKITDGAPHILG